VRAVMKLMLMRQDAVYRGFRIEGARDGACMLLRVVPTKPGLPRLTYTSFRTLPRGSWSAAVDVVCGYIDNDLMRPLREPRFSQGGSYQTLRQSP
jgi:hypothetical protein